MQSTTLNPKSQHAEPLTPYRKSLLARIHTVARRVGLEGDGYRLALLGLAGKKTATALTNQQLVQAIQDLESLRPEDHSAEALELLLR